jgi:hypothetical protein
MLGLLAMPAKLKAMARQIGPRENVELWQDWLYPALHFCAINLVYVKRDQSLHVDALRPHGTKGEIRDNNLIMKFLKNTAPGSENESK